MRKKEKSESHATAASSPESAAQPGAQAVAGCAFVFVAGILRRAA